MLQSGNISDNLDKFERLLEKIALADGVRVSHKDVSKLREIKKKLDIFHELCKNYVPEKPTTRKEKSKSAKKSMTKSMVSSIELQNGSLYDTLPEFFIGTDEILKLFKQKSEFMLSKLIDVQKIRIGCLNSELSGLIVNYLVKHMMDSLVGLNRSVIIIKDKNDDKSKLKVNSRGFGHKIEMNLISDESLLKELDSSLMDKGFVKLDKSKFLLNLFGIPLNPKYDSNNVLIEPSVDFFYGYRHEKPNYTSYLIGCNDEGVNYLPDILANHYEKNLKVKSFIDNLLMLFSRHLNEFIMERTNQYYYTWMLFNVEMILASHAIPLICVIIEESVKNQDVYFFFGKSNPLYAKLEKDSEDFICFLQDHTYLVFRRYSFAIGLRRVNCNFYPLYNKVPLF